MVKEKEVGGDDTFGPLPQASPSRGRRQRGWDISTHIQAHAGAHTLAHTHQRQMRYANTRRLTCATGEGQKQTKKEKKM